jgi:hypothetical protein
MVSDEGSKPICLDLVCITRMFRGYPSLLVVINRLETDATSLGLDLQHPEA